MSSEMAVKVDQLSKCFHIYERPRDRLLQMLVRGRKNYFREFWALQDVSFEIAKGEAIGIVGRNGSGKSTLLQIICGTLAPTAGTVETNGRIAALLELGSGFNPEFTGRENVYLNASVLGLSPDEIDARFDGIAAFADIGEFLDQPVKTYSSGMALRLAFAVQAQIDPDILIVDEALAVGDARFQAKCFDRLRQLKDNGTSILLVTHSSEQVVMHCSRAILLDSHRVQMIGEPRTVVNRYLDLLFGRPPSSPEAEVQAEAQTQAQSEIDTALKDGALGVENSTLSSKEDVFASREHYNPHEYRWGDGGASILDFYLAADGRAFPHTVKCGADVTLAVTISFNREIVNPIFGISIKTKEGVTVYGTNSHMSNNKEFPLTGAVGSVCVVQMQFPARLAGGDYFVSLGVASREGEEVVPHDRRYDSIHLVVEPAEHLYGLVDLSLSMDVKSARQHVRS